MAFLSSFLPIVIYFLLVILIVIFIVFGFKLINVVDKFDKIADNITDKVDSLNTLFKVVESTTYRLSSVYSKTVGLVTVLADKLFTRKRGKKNDEEK